MRSLRSVRALAASAIVAATTIAVGVGADPVAAASESYYVSCTGSDSHNGRSPSRAFRSLNTANNADIGPGDKLFLQRGCTWTGERLDVSWSGTAANGVLVANYGPTSAPKPLIRNGKNSNVKITGSHVTIRGLRVDYDNLPTVACNQPIGNVYGFNVTGGARNVAIVFSEASGATAGVHLSKQSSNNVIAFNDIFDNNVMTTFGANPSKDLGAWGILVRSDGNTIAANQLRDNRAKCSNQGYKLMSNSIELYEADNNLIHHNHATGDRVFSELGSSSTDVAEGNVFEFNTFETDLADSRFITTRGSGVAFGPVRSTQVFHNTIYSTGAGSQGIICGGSCGAGILELRNNVIVASEKTVYASGHAAIGPNVLWSATGETFVQIGPNGDSMPNGVIIANPRFQNAANGNFRLRSNSPGIDQSDGTRVNDVDATGTPITGNGDLGSFDS